MNGYKIVYVGLIIIGIFAVSLGIRMIRGTNKIIDLSKILFYFIVESKWTKEKIEEDKKHYLLPENQKKEGWNSIKGGIMAILLGWYSLKFNL